MKTQSHYIVNEERNNVLRASTIRPRIDYAAEVLDASLKTLVKKRLELDRENMERYKKSKSKESLRSMGPHVLEELEISYAIEALRQVHRKIDSIVGLGNLPTVLLPTISIVRTVRSKLFLVMPELDSGLGDLVLVLSGMIVDAAHLASSTLDFGWANKESRRLLDEAKLIADSKIWKQFPNLDFL